MTRAMLATTLLVVTASWAAADEVWLKGGGRIAGEVMERSPQSVVVDVGPGTVTLPMARVDRIVSSSSHLAEFRSRAARLDPADTRGWLALAAWADQNDLRTQARGAWQHVVAVDPTNAAAQAALGNVWQDGQWLDHSNAMRARGLVEFEGQWMNPGEREARLRIQAAEAAVQRENAIAGAQLAEAEARAREAEARARAAETDAARAADYDDDGIPIGYGGIGYGGIGYGGGVVGYDPGFVDPNIRPGGDPVPGPGFRPGPRRDPRPQPTPPPPRAPEAKTSSRAAGSRH